MPPRKKIDDQTPAQVAHAPSGWCLVRDHKRCPNKFVYAVCSCECHAVDTAKRKR